jgi:hypothetical protein
MNEDYLWDKSGEPDPEIQELEQILAPLRYQPVPLELPVVRRRNYLPLAIAATLLIALLAGGLWLRLRKQNIAQPQQEAKSVLSVFREPAPTPEVAKNEEPKKPVHRRHKPVFTKQEREEALAAKQQLMLALRLASEKLKLAQRRTQAPPPNQIKNQHKVG